MLNSICSVQTRKYGVVDIKDDCTFTPIAPIKYEKVIFQKYGFVGYYSNGIGDAYLFDGTLVCKNAFNPLFLADDLLLISSIAKKCYIIDYSKEKPVTTTPFDAILFFMGSKPQAHAYSANANFTSFFNTPDYLENGAHLEDLVGAKIDNAWGVINRKTKQVYAEFNNSIMVQCIGGQIAAKGFDGIVRQQL